MTELVNKAKSFGIAAHRATAHYYDGRCYAHHLHSVANFAQHYSYLLDTYESCFAAQAAAWVHDAIEDARVTYNDVSKATSPLVADIAYALTNEKGKTRKERANKKYYNGIKASKLATFVKLCDRLANVEHSARTKSRMLEVYKSENDAFLEALLGSPDEIKNHKFYPMALGILSYLDGKLPTRNFDELGTGCYCTNNLLYDAGILTDGYNPSRT